MSRLYHIVCLVLAAAIGLSLWTATGVAVDAGETAASFRAESSKSAPSLRRELMNDDYDDDGDDNSCFSADSVVQLESGEIVQMVAVRVGDRVEVMYADGSFGFSEVVFLPHKQNSDASTFIDLKLFGGGELKVTPAHLVLGGECGKSIEAMTLLQAQQLTVGHCVRSRNGEQRRVESLVKTRGRGVYTAVAMDPNGHLVVNGVVASSFGVNHFAANLYYMLHRALYAYVLPAYVMDWDVSKALNMMIGGAAISATSSFRK